MASGRETAPGAPNHQDPSATNEAIERTLEAVRQLSDQNRALNGRIDAFLSEVRAL